MSMWIDETDAEGLPDASNPFAEPASDEADEVPARRAVSSWDPTQGYPDTTQTVRIWVDENRHLTKVRISNRWRERTKATSLSSMFDIAFLFANARLGEPGGEIDEPVVTTSEPLSWDALAEISEKSRELREEAARLQALPPDQVQPGRLVGEIAQGTSDNKMVTVRLTLEGLTDKVTFDEHWLKQSRVSELCDAIMQAHQAAYAAYVPPVFEPGDHERLAHEFALLGARTQALMSNGPAETGGSR